MMLNDLLTVHINYGVNEYLINREAKKALLSFPLVCQSTKRNKSQLLMIVLSILFIKMAKL